MTIDFSKVFAFLESVGGLPKVPFVFVFCLFCAWVIRRIPWLSNDSIPIAVALCGAVALPMISDFKASPIQSARAFYFWNVLMGFIAGSLAALVYKAAVRKILKRVGAEDDSNPKAFEKSEPVPKV